MCIRDRVEFGRQEDALPESDRGPSGDVDDRRRISRVVVAQGLAAEISRLLSDPVSYTHLRAHETVLDLVCRLLLEKKTK